MKEQMKKISVLAFYKDKDEVTSTLQQLGVIHLELDEKAYSNDIKTLQERHLQVSRVMQMIQDHLPEDGTVSQPVSKGLTPGMILEEVTSLKRQLDRNLQHLDKLNKERVKLKPWGEFDRQRIKRLEEEGIRFTFYVAHYKEFQQYDLGESICEVIHVGGRMAYFVQVEKDTHETLPFEQVQLPENTLTEIDRELTRLKAENVELANKMGAYQANIDGLKHELGVINSQLEYELAINSYDDYAQGKILYLKGWYPVALEEKISKTLHEKGSTFTLEEPGPGDKVPVKLKNSSYTRLFEPITKIFQLPNYYELDLTPLIAVFYPIFFAYCLGDAGYGLIVLGASVAGWFTFLRNTRNLALLGVLLGSFTTLMGVVKSGSVFGLPITGSEALPIFSFLAQFVYIPDDQSYVFNAFNVALMIGVVQILTGVISSIVNKTIYHSFSAALPQVGKLLIIVGTLVLFLANMQNVELFKPYVLVAQIMLFSGIGLVLVSHDLKLSLFKRVGGGLLPLFFIFTGLLGDALSYVRLFALGVASSVLGLVVNQIGMQIMDSGWWGWILGIVFLLFGHSLNLALAILGAFVHPLRLTFVEFYNNAQFEGGGIEYKPFKKLTSKIE